MMGRDSIHDRSSMTHLNRRASRFIVIGALFLVGIAIASFSGLLSSSHAFWGKPNSSASSVNQSPATGNGADSGTAGVSGELAAKPQAARAAIGVNLTGVTDWSTQWPFVDVFKTSRPWLSQREGAEFGKGGKLKLTSEGWVASLEPGQWAETVMMIDSPHYPAGLYTLLYEGEGKITFAFDNAKIVQQSPGKMQVQVKPNGAGVFLQIKESNPQNPIRNIRFIMPGFEQTYQTQPFHPLFLERLAKFKALRFMDWESTNDSEVRNWSDRSTPNSPTQAGDKGVALEYLIQLANTLKINPWFTIPAKASDDYVRQFATMVRDRLNPSLKAHIEYSNEVWNTMFSQQRYAAEQGMSRKLDENDYTATLRYYSERSVEIFKIFEQVFGSQKTRLVKVLAGQAANPWTAEQILGWKDAYKQADAYAIAPYFDGDDKDKNHKSDLNDPGNVDATLKLTPEQVVDSLMDGIPKIVKSMVEKNYKVATQQFGLPLFAYEGGPHLTSYQFPEDKEPRVTQLFAAANRHPKMREAYQLYLNQWQQSGGQLFNQFVDVARTSKWGFWGALEYQDQDPKAAPKYMGLMDFIQADSSR